MARRNFAFVDATLARSVFCRRLVQKLNQYKAQIAADYERFNSVEKAVDDLRDEIEALKREVDDVYVFDENVTLLQESLKVSAVTERM